MAHKGSFSPFSRFPSLSFWAHEISNNLQQKIHNDPIAYGGLQLVPDIAYAQQKVLKVHGISEPWSAENWASISHTRDPSKRPQKIGDGLTML